MSSKWYLSITILVMVRCATSTKVQTTHGPIEGKTITQFNGKQVDAFLGVPFAAPPIGKNRFAPPQPLEPWNEALEVKNLPKSCIQAVPDEFRKVVWFVADSEDSEDCLYLNLWVPKCNPDVKKPIMIWIHGGAFLSGSSNMPLYDGSTLAAEKDVIVASMNYRLAMFGFLYLNTTDVPGNAGFQDQIQAIQWIKNNAERFGGNREEITLFGESAGGISVWLHLMNSKITNLFQRGIAESGSPLIDVSTLSESQILNNSISLAKSSNCPVDDFDQMLACLRAKPTAELVKSDNVIPLYARVTFAGVRNGIEVPSDFSDALRKVSWNKPIMSGNIPREMGYFLTSFYPVNAVTEDTTISEDDMRQLMKGMLNLNDERLQDVGLHEYKSFDGTYNSSQVRTQFVDLVNDFTMLCPSIDITKLATNKPNQVYYYYFTHRPSKVGKLPLPEWLGVVHGDELPFVFGQPLESKNGYTNVEKDLSMRMMTFWTNFAKTGNPNGDGATGVKWPALEPNGNFTYIVLDLNQSVSTFLRERECGFWTEVYPSIMSIQDQLDHTLSN